MSSTNLPGKLPVRQDGNLHATGLRWHLLARGAVKKISSTKSAKTQILSYCPGSSFFALFARTDRYCAYEIHQKKQGIINSNQNVTGW
jgi:hypothetical protein